jgi:hypothetical protein
LVVGCAVVSPAFGQDQNDVAATFPLVLSNGPPADGKAPNGRNALAEVAAAGVTHIRTGVANWTTATIAAQRRSLDVVGAHGLRAWLWLGDAAVDDSPLLAQVVDALGGHSALGAYKGVDEPRNPFRGADWIRPAGPIRAYRRIKSIDPVHPVVIIQAPIGTVPQLTPYRPAFDVTGADVYPVSYPPGAHTKTGNRDISVVGDVTRKMITAAGQKPVWMTLQIAWSGVVPSKDHPNRVPRFPTLQAERFMAYQAIIAGARGLAFFGGHLIQVAAPMDAELGWNWSFWQEVLRPLTAELSSSDIAPALGAARASSQVKASTADVELVTRTNARFGYVLAARRKGTTSVVTFSGVPSKVKQVEALGEWVQRPLPPPIGAGSQQSRLIDVEGGRFRDWLAPHDARVYRFLR